MLPMAFLVLVLAMEVATGEVGQDPPDCAGDAVLMGTHCVCPYPQMCVGRKCSQAKSSKPTQQASVSGWALAHCFDCTCATGNLPGLVPALANPGTLKYPLKARSETLELEESQTQPALAPARKPEGVVASTRAELFGRDGIVWGSAARKQETWFQRPPFDSFTSPGDPAGRLVASPDSYWSPLTSGEATHPNVKAAAALSRCDNPDFAAADHAQPADGVPHTGPGWPCCRGASHNGGGHVADGKHTRTCDPTRARDLRFRTPGHPDPAAAPGNGGGDAAYLTGLDFVHALGNRTAVLIGDSVGHQMAMSIECAARAIGATVTSFHRGSYSASVMKSSGLANHTSHPDNPVAAALAKWISAKQRQVTDACADATAEAARAGHDSGANATRPPPDTLKACPRGVLDRAKAGFLRAEVYAFSVNGVRHGTLVYVMQYGPWEPDVVGAQTSTDTTSPWPVGVDAGLLNDIDPDVILVAPVNNHLMLQRSRWLLDLDPRMRARSPVRRLLMSPFVRGYLKADRKVLMFTQPSASLFNRPYGAWAQNKVGRLSPDLLDRAVPGLLSETEFDALGGRGACMPLQRRHPHPITSGRAANESAWVDWHMRQEMHLAGVPLASNFDGLTPRGTVALVPFFTLSARPDARNYDPATKLGPDCVHLCYQPLLWEPVVDRITRVLRGTAIQ